MQSLKLVIFCATQKKHKEDTTLWKSLVDLGLEKKIETHFYTENKKSLAKIYNSAISMVSFDEKCDGIIFVHDDVCLEHDPRNNLFKLFNEFDVVGVAGCSRAEIKFPALWHLMGGGFGSGNLHGMVQHIQTHYPPNHVPITHKAPTYFGPCPHKVVMIDGVFMALNRKAINSGVMFDENCPSDFHFYDLLFCKKALEKDLKIGVGDIIITHESPGLRNFTDEWKSGNDYYLKQYE